MIESVCGGGPWERPRTKLPNQPSANANVPPGRGKGPSDQAHRKKKIREDETGVLKGTTEKAQAPAELVFVASGTVQWKRLKEVGGR